MFAIPKRRDQQRWRRDNERCHLLQAGSMAARVLRRPLARMKPGRGWVQIANLGLIPFLIEIRIRDHLAKCLHQRGGDLVRSLLEVCESGPRVTHATMSSHKPLEDLAEGARRQRQGLGRSASNAS